MNDNNGFIVLNRKMLDWEWYHDINTVRLFIHCLFKANWKNAKFEGIEIPRGSFVTSLASLSKETDLSIKQVRTALEHLILTKELANKSYSKFRVITVNNYNLYQDYDKDKGNQSANKGQAEGKQRATIEQINKETNKQYISTTTTNSTSLFEYIEQNFGRTLNPIEIEELSTWDDNELTRYVIKKSVLSNVYSFRYISKVLYTYKQKGIKTVVDAEKEYQRFEKERNSKSNKRKSGMEKFNEVLDNIPD